MCMGQIRQIFLNTFMHHASQTCTTHLVDPAILWCYVLILHFRDSRSWRSDQVTRMSTWHSMPKYLVVYGARSKKLIWCKKSDQLNDVIFGVVVFDRYRVALLCCRIKPKLRRPAWSRVIFFEIFQNCHIFCGTYLGFIPIFLETDR